MHIAMIGPALDAMGGISSVARTWVETDAAGEVELEYVGTMLTGPKRKKIPDMGVRQARFVARLARGWRPDLFHIHLSSWVSFYRKLAYFEEARATGAPVVVHLHGSDMEDFLNAGGAHEAAIRHMFSLAAAVVCLSQDMARAVRALMGDDARLEVVYNPVDLELFQHPPRPPRAAPVVLFMGLVGQRKGTWDLLEAWPRVLEAVPDARLRIGGNGETDKLMAEIARLGIQDSVEPLGWVSGEDKLRHFEEADLYCLPSYHEGLPISVLEAMADSLPVVSTPVAGIPEAVVDGQTGLLVQPGDRAGLAAALVALLSDPDRRRAMGIAGRARAEACFDAEVVMRQVVALWRELAGEGTQS